MWKDGSHKETFTQLINRFKLNDLTKDSSEAAFTLYAAALQENERRSCPRLGIATERRTLQHVGEVFYEDNVLTLICFMCNCKHLAHIGCNKFGEPQRKGRISMRTKMASKLQEQKTSWSYNSSYKRFRNTFGDAVSTDPHLQEGSWEWKRRLQGRDENSDMLCSPEDVRRSATCRHPDTEICNSCQIPLCNECWKHICNNTKCPIALTNENFIGYIHSYIAEHKVTHLECACIVIPSIVYSMALTYVEQECCK